MVAGSMLGEEASMVAGSMSGEEAWRGRRPSPPGDLPRRRQLPPPSQILRRGREGGSRVEAWRGGTLLPPACDLLLHQASAAHALSLGWRAASSSTRRGFFTSSCTPVALSPSLRVVWMFYVCNGGEVRGSSGRRCGGEARRQGRS
jgi:hypothetical protein